jgi:hypothetical protein
MWSPLGSPPRGCPCNPWSEAKNSSFPQLAAAVTACHTLAVRRTPLNCAILAHTLFHTASLSFVLRCRGLCPFCLIFQKTYCFIRKLIPGQAIKQSFGAW